VHASNRSDASHLEGQHRRERKDLRPGSQAGDIPRRSIAEAPSSIETKQLNCKIGLLTRGLDGQSGDSARELLAQ
jgi:hypothetical protein